MVYNFCLNKVSKITQNRCLPEVNKKYKKIFVHSVKMDLLTKQLKAIAKIRGIKGYKSMPKDELLSSLTSSKPVKKG